METSQKRRIEAFEVNQARGPLDRNGGDHAGPEDVSRGDGLLGALTVLTEALERNNAEERLLLTRLSSLHRALASGASATETLAGEPDPGTMQLLGGILARLTDGSGTARRALARAMRTEGASIPAIAQVFGVTHQRVSNVLRGP